MIELDERIVAWGKVHWSNLSLQDAQDTFTTHIGKFNEAVANTDLLAIVEELSCMYIVYTVMVNTPHDVDGNEPIEWHSNLVTFLGIDSALGVFGFDFKKTITQKVTEMYSATPNEEYKPTYKANYELCLLLPQQEK